MMDEQLIHEVQNHVVIYNRQKYFLNSVNRSRCETKEEAWENVARKLGTDVETCKKRWKYLRERYVQQRKQGEHPTFEHLSRPYLEKMKFLDQHIHPRKSYRSSNTFHLDGTTVAMVNAYKEFLDSSKSNDDETVSNSTCHQFSDSNYSTGKKTFHKENDQEGESEDVKYDTDLGVHNYCTVNLNNHKDNSNDSNNKNNNSSSNNSNVLDSSNSFSISDRNIPHSSYERTSAALLKTQENIQQHLAAAAAAAVGYRSNSEPCFIPRPSSSSSLKSSLSSPQTAETVQQSQPCEPPNTKKSRLDSSTQVGSNNCTDNNNDREVSGSIIGNNDARSLLPTLQQCKDEDENSVSDEPQSNNLLNARNLAAAAAAAAHMRNMENGTGSQNDFFHHFANQHLMQPQFAGHFRSSEQLLGELVTSELLKMSRERKRVAQRRILEILFFDD